VVTGMENVDEVHGMDVINNATIFNDHCVLRETIGKLRICAMRAVCILMSARCCVSSCEYTLPKGEGGLRDRFGQ
jgi:hypothetical protein